MITAATNLVNLSLPHSHDLRMPCAASYIGTKFIFMLIPLISEICYSLKIAAIIMRYTPVCLNQHGENSVFVSCSSKYVAYCLASSCLSDDILIVTVY